MPHGDLLPLIPTTEFRFDIVLWQTDTVVGTHIHRQAVSGQVVASELEQDVQFAAGRAWELTGEVPAYRDGVHDDKYPRHFHSPLFCPHTLR